MLVAGAAQHVLGSADGFSGPRLGADAVLDVAFTGHVRLYGNKDTTSRY